jgi:hypothetical protein
MHAQMVTSQLLSPCTAPSAARVPATSSSSGQLGLLSPLSGSSASHPSDPIYEGLILREIDRGGSLEPVKTWGVCAGYHLLPCSTPEGERIKRDIHLPKNDRFPHDHCTATEAGNGGVGMIFEACACANLLSLVCRPGQGPRPVVGPVDLRYITLVGGLRTRQRLPEEERPWLLKICARTA